MLEKIMQAPEPKPWIAAIDPYVPGKAAAAGKPAIKLSANESPLGPSPHAVVAMAQVHGTSHRYPEGSSLALRIKIAALHGIDPAQIICGTGSDEILNLAAQAYAGPGDEVLFSRHSFMVYPIAARRCGATPVEAPDSDYSGDVDALLACVTPRTRVVFIANPNNPTGTLMPKAEILRLHAGLPQNILLVLDAAYAEFVVSEYESGLELSQSAPNVLHTRTFSKIYGLAAERVGWGTASPAIIEALNRIRGPFNVTTAATAGACAALEDQAWLQKARAHNDEWLGWMNSEIAQLGNYGLRAIPSAANFVLIEFSGADNRTAERANEYLQSEGYIVRWLPGQGLGTCLRVTIGTEAENRGFMRVLRTFCETSA
jgi:histidinol-phosphate aminotransferase